MKMVLLAVQANLNINIWGLERAGQNDVKILTCLLLNGLVEILKY